MSARFLAALLALIAIVPAAAQAAGSVSLKSAVFVEKTETGKDGRKHISLHEPALVTPGDKLVFILSYRNAGRSPASDVIVTNPVPSAVAYQSVQDRAAEVSVDGGQSWGNLPRLIVREDDGSSRGARPEDVTHVRWMLKQSVPAGAQGKLSFRGVVR